ncbi:MAG: SDR family oxidoreductase [Myxococcaceae bacterium]|jgi:hypothetical protein|nr:SDR family oxidoreductase [Myxococcaceae bacterium]
MDWFDGKTVIITGGSTGIGAAFAEALAPRGARLVLVARSKERLETLARDLRSTHRAQVDTVALDLAAPGGVAQLVSALEAAGATPDVLVNNAGFATYGAFATQGLEPQLDEVALNVSVVVELTHRLLPGLVARRGGLLNVASTAAFQPVPFMAVYGATKAFVLSFTEALWAEYRSQGLRVLALCPGATETPFFDRVGAAEASVGAKASPHEVAALGLRALLEDRPSVVHGFGNRLGTLAPRFVTRAQAARITESLMRPRTTAALPAPRSAP